MLTKKWPVVTLCVIGLIIVVALFFRPEPKARHVLLVVFDTLRADRMSVYGYEKETTPFLQQRKNGRSMPENGNLRRKTEGATERPTTRPSGISTMSLTKLSTC